MKINIKIKYWKKDLKYKLYLLFGISILLESFFSFFLMSSVIKLLGRVSHLLYFPLLIRLVYLDTRNQGAEDIRFASLKRIKITYIEIHFSFTHGICLLKLHISCNLLIKSDQVDRSLVFDLFLLSFLLVHISLAFLFEISFLHFFDSFVLLFRGLLLNHLLLDHGENILLHLLFLLGLLIFLLNFPVVIVLVIDFLFLEIIKMFVNLWLDDILHIPIILH